MYQKLKQFFLKHGFERNYFIAYSGGLDSSVLLHLLNTLQKEHPIKLHAVHIHHGLNKNADAWMLHCQNYCNEIAVPFSHFKVNAKAQLGESPENIARIARYNILTDLLNENDFLLTAHHQDDQAETLLLQLFRGSGLKGLAAMPHVKSLGKGVHARPLLNFSRRELQQYAEKNNYNG
jgi:tRNA(Ile)-lysidine synthase